jgi:hypothetical protein
MIEVKYNNPMSLMKETRLTWSCMTCSSQFHKSTRFPTNVVFHPSVRNDLKRMTIDHLRPLSSFENHFINHSFGYHQSDCLYCAVWDWLPQMVSKGRSANIFDTSTKVNDFFNQNPKFDPIQISDPSYW